MEISKELRDFFLKGDQIYLPHVMIDCVIFGYHDQQLKILLSKNGFIDDWCLPGGFIVRGETLQQAAERTIVDRSGIPNLFLQQFRAFGDPNRTRYREFDAEKWFERTGLRLEKNNWLLDESISIGFYAITDFLKSVPGKDIESVECAWHDLHRLPPLAFDHENIVKEALRALRIQLYHSPIGYNMLPEKFTLAEIHTLYQTLLGKKFDVSNFARKLTVLGIIKRLNEHRVLGGHRSPYLFTFDKKKYQKALEEGAVLF
jgi:ADP-ribose pyrophosphatase YjhB (NUDIX family)